MKSELKNIETVLVEELKNHSTRFIEEFRDAERYLISQYMGEIKQFTIDQLQDWEDIVDMDNFSTDTARATSYHYSTLLEVLVKDSRDHECISVFESIADRWSTALDLIIKVYRVTPS